MCLARHGRWIKSVKVLYIWIINLKSTGKGEAVLAQWRHECKVQATVPSRPKSTHTHTHTHIDPRSIHVFAFVMLICLICIIALPIPRTIIITIVFFVYADKKFHSQFELLLLLFGGLGEMLRNCSLYTTNVMRYVCVCVCVCQQNACVCMCLGILFWTWVDCWICVTWISLPSTPPAVYVCVCVWVICKMLS